MELLSPAGNMERLEIAFHYGADAVYLAGNRFGLRAFADNFDDEQLVKGIEYAHKHGKKVYVTANVFMRGSDIHDLKEYFRVLEQAGADGVIISDIGAVELAKNTCPRLEVHISTQFNTMNELTASLLYKMGASRVVLARELSLDEIKRIRDNTPSELGLEAFVHGAMCMSYSGRCLLSSFFTGRQANRGECTQSCRWEYYLCEKQRPGQYLPIQEDERGTYILNSRDMCMIEYLKELEQAGVDSLKIEGRMKTAYYVASVTNAYRRALELLKQNKPFDPALKEELYKAANRDFTTGFYFGRPGDEGQRVESGKCVQSYEFSAVCVDWDGEWAILEQRNKINEGDVLEILSPGEQHGKEMQIKRMLDMEGAEIKCANKVQQIIKVPCSLPLKNRDILRRKLHL